jgi:hypothetical protein
MSVARANGVNVKVAQIEVSYRHRADLGWKAAGRNGLFDGPSQLPLEEL